MGLNVLQTPVTIFSYYLKYTTSHSFTYVAQKYLTEECMLARLAGLEEERVSFVLASDQL